MHTRFDMSDIKTLIVFVQLGKNKSNTLNTFAANATSRFPNSLIVLLTDCPRKWKDFPGKVVEIQSDSFFKAVHSDEDQVKHLRMGGYWLHTLNRLFALGELEKHFPQQYRVIHLESDVISFITPVLAEDIFSNFSGVAIPRYSQDSGIASILLASNLTELSNIIGKLRSNALVSDKELNDMDLLGLGLNSNLIQDLNKISFFTTNPDNGSKIRLHFDGAAIGQYLFGVDTRKRKWEPESGYINKCATFPLKEIRWDITDISENNPYFIKFHHEDTTYMLANIHVHSKIPLSTFPNNYNFWKQLVIDMNHGEIRRYSVKNPFDWNQLKVLEALRRLRKAISLD